MPYVVGDFLDMLERELLPSRRDLAQRIDRVEALAQLRSHALSVSADLQRAISVDDVFSSAKDERERAFLKSLANRIAGEETPGGNPAHEKEGEQAAASLSPAITEGPGG